MIRIKKKIIIAAVLVIILAPFIYIQFNKQQASNAVWQYLSEEKGYEESDVKSITGQYSFFGIPTYYVEVIFTNEPTIVYLYFSHHAKGQFEYYELNGEKIPEEDLKNYEPIL